MNKKRFYVGYMPYTFNNILEGFGYVLNLAFLYQADEKPFNRGKLFNIGYKEAKKFNHTCFVFHDVDLIPENDNILYGCVRSPMHLSRAVNTLNYK